MFGEHVVGTDPDCKTERGLKKCSPKVITRTVSKAIVHENYNTKDNKNDIALLRLNESVPLFNENPIISAVLPVCLPWSNEELFTEDAENVKLVSLDCRALPDITSSLEVRQIFKIRTVWKPDIFFPGRWSFNSFKKRNENPSKWEADI